MDLISRQEAINAIHEWGLIDGLSEGQAIEILSDEEKVPSVQPQRWIPVTEALPDAGAEVWVTIKGHDVIKCKPGETIEQAVDRISKIRWVARGYWSEDEHAWNDPSYGCPLMVQPIAWMPINRPEPWRGGQDEQT